MVTSGKAAARDGPGLRPIYRSDSSLLVGLRLFRYVARVARAEYTYMQAVNRAADIAVRARSEVREAYAAYRTAYDLAKHYRDEIVPLRKRISEENLLRYNGMLISVFELLADARQQVGSVNAYIETLRDYWLSETSLNLALNGKSPGAMSLGGASMQAASDNAPAH